MTYDELIKGYSAWAASTQDVRAVLILGSRARTDHPADEWSDLDLMVFARNPEQLVQSAEWTTAIAPSWLTFVERTADGSSWERRTLYAGGLDVDVALFTEDLLEELQHGIPPDMGDIIRRGVKILVDKDGKLGQVLNMPLPSTTLFQKPTQAEFKNEVSNFWYHTLWSVKHLRRGELWWAKSCVDMHLKELLKHMFEWHAHAIRGEEFDTWLRGRFLEEWADPRAVEQLRDAFAHYDTGDLARALRATMNLYRWLEDETATRWGYSIPLEGEQRAEETALGFLE